MNYLAWHLMQLQFLTQERKQNVVLLGDGFFARGFLHNIDRSKFHITQVRRDTFINPQDLIAGSSSNYHLHLRDIFTKPADQVVNMDIQTLSVNPDHRVIHMNNSPLKYDHIVIGLGAKKSLVDWEKDIKTLKTESSVNIVGMGPTGIELAFMLAGENIKVSIYDSLSQDKVLSYLTASGKQTVLEKLKKHNIKTTYGTFYNGTGKAVFCVGTQPNPLTAGFTVNDKLQVHGLENVHMGGDGAHTPYPKSAQVAYQQGSYVAHKLNGMMNDEPFKYLHEGTSLTIGDSRALVEGHRFIPNGVYPDIIIRLYSLFCV